MPHVMTKLIGHKMDVANDEDPACGTDPAYNDHLPHGIKPGHDKDGTCGSNPAPGTDPAHNRCPAGGTAHVNGTDPTHGTHPANHTDPANGTDPVADDPVACDTDSTRMITICRQDGLPYEVCGVQYLPKKYYEKAEIIKRTMKRMSIKRRSTSDGNLKSKLEVKHKDESLRNSHVQSLPEMVHMSVSPSQLESPTRSISKGDEEILDQEDENEGLIMSTDPDVEFTISLSDGDGDASPVSTDSNKNEVRYLGKSPKCQYPFENIVLSGGGSKGYAYIGALKALEDAGILSQIRRVGGSSAGAICGGLVAVGCSPQEIADTFFCDIKWLFQDQKCACCFCLPKIWKNYGINPGIRFQQIYGEQIAKKVQNPDITFMELYQDYGRELCIVVTNLTRMCSEYCHWTTTPNLPIRQAVRISMAFPVMYEPVKCNLFGEEHLYMDGGTLDQYPVHCFDGPLFELNHNLKTGQKRVLNDKTLGLYVVAEDPIDYKIWSSFFGRELPYSPPYLPNTKLARRRLKEELRRRRRSDKCFDSKKYLRELKSKPVIVNDKPLMRHYTLKNKLEIDITNFGLYCKASLSTVIVSQRRLHVKPEDINRTVAINCGYVGTNDYDLEPADREFMIRCGYEHTDHFLQDYLKQRQTDGATGAIGVKRQLILSPDGSTLQSRPSSLTKPSKETEV